MGKRDGRGKGGTREEAGEGSEGNSSRDPTELRLLEQALRVSESRESSGLSTVRAPMHSLERKEECLGTGHHCWASHVRPLTPPSGSYSHLPRGLCHLSSEGRTAM